MTGKASSDRISISYKGLLVLSHVLLINSANLPVKQKFRGKGRKTKLSLCLISQEALRRRFKGCLTPQLLKAERLSRNNGHSVRYSPRHGLKYFKQNLRVHILTLQGLESRKREYFGMRLYLDSISRKSL